ncbi:MAG: glycosyltransferase family 4 protein [Parcubacteria group bacterium]|jgi:glycosyltransferase involved in cell wall biosynthesis
MKVLFLNYEYPPIGSGAANATFCILHEYAQIPELEVDLITSSASGEYVQEELGKNIKIHRLPVGKNADNLHLQTRKNLILYSIKSYFFARKLIKKAKQSGQAYELTHSFFTVPCGFVSMLLKFEFGLPYIVSLRGSDVPGYSDRFVFIYKFITPIIKLVWKKSSFVIANSQGLKDLALESRTKKEIGIIFNGVEIDRFKPDENLRNKEKFIITVGASRITHRKGFNYLIEAIAMLSPKYPNIYAKIMGEGNAKEELEQLVKKLKLDEKIEFLGRIPRENLAPFYQEADLFVLPSLNEGMSNAMLEALSSGLPLLSTNTGGADELLKDGSNGFIIKMKDASDIAEKIEKIIANKNLQDSMGKASRELAETMSWQKVAQQYFDLYKQTINHA